MYSAVCFAFSFVLPRLARRWGRRLTHALCLLLGAVGLVSVAAIDDKYLLLLPMVGVGMAWASTLAMPYAILAGALPPGKTGIYMGIFNFFIVIPEILAALGFGTLLERILTDESTLVAHLGGDNRLAIVVVGGLSLAVAAALCAVVVEPKGYPMRPTEHSAGEPSTFSPSGEPKTLFPEGERVGEEFRR